MKVTVRFLRHGGVYRPMCCLFESLTRSAAFRSGPGQTFRTHRKLLRPAHRRDEPRPAIPQRVARQHCPPPLHRHAHPKSVPGSGTMNLQRTVNSVLTVCLNPGDHPSCVLTSIRSRPPSVPNHTSISVLPCSPATSRFTLCFNAASFSMMASSLNPNSGSISAAPAEP